MTQVPNDSGRVPLPPPPLNSPPIQPTLSAPGPPRVWPSVLAAFGALPVLLAISTVLGLVVMLFFMIATGEKDLMAAAAWVAEDFAVAPAGLAVFILPIQIAIAGIAVTGAILSPVSWRSRLGLTRGRAAWWHVAILAMGTIAIMLASTIVNSWLFPQPSEHLEQITEMLLAGSGLSAFMVVVLISVPPGVAEELLFRGYVQTRLLKRWSPWLAIGVTSIAFALVHIDPQHVLGVLPIGVWLGIVAWRTGSVLPCIVCHAFNNAVAVMLVRAGAVYSESMVFNLAAWLVLLMCVMALIVAIVLLIAYGRTTRPSQKYATKP